MTSQSPTVEPGSTGSRVRIRDSESSACPPAFCCLPEARGCGGGWETWHRTTQRRRMENTADGSLDGRSRHPHCDPRQVPATPGLSVPVPQKQDGPRTSTVAVTSRAPPPPSLLREASGANRAFLRPILHGLILTQGCFLWPVQGLCLLWRDP